MNPEKPAPSQAMLDSQNSFSIGEYEPPRIVEIGHVRELTGGSSASGSADANSQYYW